VALEHVLGRYSESHPSWQVVIGRHRVGPWVKARAVADAVSRAAGEVLVVADADVWCDDIALAVDVVTEGASWAIPHDQVWRLDPPSTGAVLVGGPLGASGTEQSPYPGRLGGGITVIERMVWDRVPLDARFAGWGQEDEAWGIALWHLVGVPWRGSAPLWHLWHPPQERMDRRTGSPHGRALFTRYRRAARRGGLAEIVAEAREVLDESYTAADTDSGHHSRQPDRGH